MRIFAIFIFFILQVKFINAQSEVHGKVIDNKSGLNISGASAMVSNEKTGAISDANGSFSLNLKPGKYLLVFNHIAYEPKEVPVKLDPNQVLDLGIIGLDERIIGLEEINVIASTATDRQTPVAATNLSAALIEQRNGSQEYPEIMKRVPGVYATKFGGGIGDARVTIRGFQQENVALLLNGVPVSSVENGLVYWSNWAGLADATQSIQVQRGLGASKVAVNSVGGTINIITRTTDVRQGGSITQGISDFGLKRTMLSLSSGLMDNGFAVQFLGSRTTGSGFADATHVDGWAYYLSISKNLGSEHKLVFTALGSPERHGQRSYGLTQDEYLKFGNKYNPNWGMFNGKVISVNENFYHKPQMTLNHYWNISEKSFLATSAYYSFGHGGGRFTEAFDNLPAFAIRKNNQIDWEAIHELNSTHTDEFTTSGGETLSGYSKVILTNYLATHYWYGILSNFDHQINENTKLTAGVHVRDFKSRLREEIDDLMGGQFWIEDYAWAIEGQSGRRMIKNTGDVIKVDNGALVSYASAFGQLEYSYDAGTAFLAGTLSNTWFQREDRYNYVENIRSRQVSRQGFDIKAGTVFNLDVMHHIYANSGYYSREPYYKFVFVNFSNAIARDLKNERIAAGEIGYGFSNRNIALRMNAYSTYWMDKSLLSMENVQLVDSTMTRALVRGLDAWHNGLELEAYSVSGERFTYGASASIGQWKWQNDVIAELYDDNQAPAGTTEVYAKGLYVGDAPQTQIFLTASYKIWDDLTLAAEWVYYDRLYANFDPAGRNNAADRNQPYRIPGYHLTDLFATYSFTIGNMHAQAHMNCYNLFDKESITRGEDGASHDLDTFRGFRTFDRSFHLSLKLLF
ncbi:MAG: TonB-dependent receptor [Bacteroidales bacterium]|nr:TonB-dependent receptor [Bacteroidales bacterium]